MHQSSIEMSQQDVRLAIESGLTLTVYFKAFANSLGPK